MRSSVVLPQPEGPSSTMNSLSATVRMTSSAAPAPSTRIRLGEALEDLDLGHRRLVLTGAVDAPHVQQVSADQEDEDQRGHDQREAAGEAVGQRRVATATQSTGRAACGSSTVSTAAANTSFHDITKAKMRTRRCPAAPAAATTRRKACSGVQPKTRPPPRGRRGRATKSATVISTVIGSASAVCTSATAIACRRARCGGTSRPAAPPARRSAARGSAAGTAGSVAAAEGEAGQRVAGRRADQQRQHQRDQPDDRRELTSAGDDAGAIAGTTCSVSVEGRSAAAASGTG